MRSTTKFINGGQKLMQIAVLSQELSGSLCCVRLIRITHLCVWCPIHLFWNHRGH